MNIGDQPAFPVYDNENQLWKAGMTYRQWLVGIIMSGLAANPNYSPHTAGHAAKDAFEAVEAIIARMEKEGEFWLFRVKERPEWGPSVGRTQLSFGGQEILVFSDDYHPIGKHLFGNYDWHRIELPKGWE